MTADLQRASTRRSGPTRAATRRIVLQPRRFRWVAWAVQCLFLLVLGVAGPLRDGEAERETETSKDSEAVAHTGVASLLAHPRGAKRVRTVQARTWIHAHALQCSTPAPREPVGARQGPGWQRPRRVVPNDDDDGNSARLSWRSLERRLS